MKPIRYAFLICVAAILIGISIGEPRWLTENSFLTGAMSIDLLALLVVILTITFASVANMHLTLNRLLAGAPPSMRAAADEVREEINGNAWVLFWAFVTAGFALVLRGALACKSNWLAMTYGTGIMVVILNAMVLHDIYQAMFALTTLEVPSPKKGTANAEEDYTC